MVTSAQIRFVMESVANLAVIAAGAAIVWTVAGGVRPFRSVNGGSGDRPFVENIENSGLETNVDLLTEGARTGEPVIVEVSDFQCPFCGKYALETLPRVRKEMLESQSVAYAFVNLPLESRHPQAMAAARTGACAREQHKFWEMHDLLFGNQRELTSSAFDGFVAELGLDRQAFARCGQTADLIVRRDIAEASRLGVAATPTIFIGELVEPTGRVILKRRINGAASFDILKTTVESVAHRGV